MPDTETSVLLHWETKTRLTTKTSLCFKLLVETKMKILVWLSSIHYSFIHLFAIYQKYNNSIQKYIKDNIQCLFQLSYLQD